RVVPHDIHRPHGHVATRCDTVQVDQWNVPRHGKSQTLVVVMSRVRAAVAIAEKAIRAETVVVRALLALSDWNRGDTDWTLWKQRWLEDALRTDQRDPSALEIESALQEVAGKHCAVETGLLGQELKGVGSDSGVEVSLAHLT